jgi:ABC-type glycerol-3-phosphate transport system substrate-binding protein
MRRAAVIAGLAALSLAQVIGAGEIKVMSPGVIANSGLREVSAAFTKKTGVTVTILPKGMGTVVSDFKTTVPAADIVMLPMDLMGTLALEGGIKPGSFTPLGRVEIGLFKATGAPVSDISSVDKVIAVGRVVYRSGWRQPAGIHERAAPQEARVRRCQGSGRQRRCRTGTEARRWWSNGLGLGLIHGVHPRGQASNNPNLAGRLPAELGMYMDMATAIHVKSPNSADAEAFIKFMVSPDVTSIWSSMGTDRY